MRGIVAAAGYVPYRSLDRAAITEALGGTPQRGDRSVASYDEDTTTMGVEAARPALRGVAGRPDQLWFSTAEPAYLEKTNAAAIHAALRLDPAAGAHDFGGAARSGVGALRAACEGSGTVLAVASGRRGGLATSPDEALGGDAAAAVLVGEADPEALVATYLGGSAASEEFTDRWRVPGEARTRRWEERFAETRYGPLVADAWPRALDRAGLTAEEVDRVAVTGTHARATDRAARAFGGIEVVDGLRDSVGMAGTAAASLELVHALEQSDPGDVVAAVNLADGVDILIFRAGSTPERESAPLAVADQIADRSRISYGTFARWRGTLAVEPPNRPEPARYSASAAARRQEWKYGFVGSEGSVSGRIHLPPARISIDPADPDDGLDPVAMSDRRATVRTFTVDRLAYSPSPPVVFAVVDFDGGGRMPIELTDVDPDDVEVGDRVEMTFRRIGTADGLHNYFWKARPVRGSRAGGE